jgi:uncharacterized protein YjbI with pentapeptide repeats
MIFILTRKMKKINYFKIVHKLKHHDGGIITVMMLLGIYFISKEWISNDLALSTGYKALALWFFKQKDKTSKIASLVNLKFNNLHEEKDSIRELIDAQEKESNGDELHDKNNFWETLTQVQDVFNDSEISDSQKATEIYKISKFYAPQYIDFASHIHTLFKDCLGEFWKNYIKDENAPNLPRYIEIIYHIIKHQSHQKDKGKNFFHKSNGLSFVDFKLKFADFRYVNFANENLITADLNCANFTNADLANADLANADLTDVNFANANLIGANFSDANFTDANFSHAKLTGTNLNHANLVFVNFTYADLSRANLNRADLSHANLIRTDLTNADLSNSDLTHANLTESNLIGANLIHANLSHAKLTEVNLSFTKLYYENSYFTCIYPVI